MDMPTEEHFAFFEAEVRKWLKRMQLDFWKVLVTRDDIQGYAQTAIDYLSRTANVVLCNEWDDELLSLNEDTLREIAQHEVMHILVEPVATIAKARFVSQDSLVANLEELVRRLVRLIPDEETPLEVVLDC